MRLEECLERHRVLLAPETLLKGGRCGRPLDMEPRSSGKVYRRNRNAAPLEWLHAYGILDDPIARPTDLCRFEAKAAGARRYAIAILIRDTIEKGEVSPARGIDYEATRVDGGAPSHITDIKLDAISRIETWITEIGEPAFTLLRSIIHDDDWPWERVDDRRLRAALYDQIRQELDAVCVVENTMPLSAYDDRWC